MFQKYKQATIKYRDNQSVQVGSGFMTWTWLGKDSFRS